MKKKKKYIFSIVIIILLAIAIYLFFTFSNIYSVKAVTVESGSSITTTTVTERFDFGNVPQGEQVTKTVVLENTGNSDHSIKIWMMGSTAQMMDVEPGNSFKLEAGTSQDVKFILKMPDTAREEKKYTGRVIIFELP
jgi:hypothetical protein